MKRNEGESFDAYKARRKDENKFMRWYGNCRLFHDSKKDGTYINKEKEEKV
jgi:hypothetical protein